MSRHLTAAAFAGWALATALLLQGFPPPIDLAAHGGQLQTFAALLQGNAELGEAYELHGISGYGLLTWLFVPVAIISTGALAIKVALWVTLQLYLLAVWQLSRAFGRSEVALLWALPLAFNLSYWYGFVPSLFAQVLMLLALAQFLRMQEGFSWKRVLLFNLLAVGTLLGHLLSFGVLVLCVSALLLFPEPRWHLLGKVALGFVLPALLALPLSASVMSSSEPTSVHYDAASHLLFFQRNYRSALVLNFWAPLALTAGLLAWAWRRRRVADARATVLLLTLVAVYLLLPKEAGLAFLIAQRLPFLAALFALLLLDASELPRLARIAAHVLTLAVLVETALFHVRFAREVAGLEQMVFSGPAPGKHAFVSLEGDYVPDMRLPFLSHAGDWWTAYRGGVSDGLFADAPHQPVQWRPGHAIHVPAELPADGVAALDHLLLYGSGPLPASLAYWTEVSRAGKWRKLAPPSSHAR